MAPEEISTGCSEAPQSPGSKCSPPSWTAASRLSEGNCKTCISKSWCRLSWNECSISGNSQWSSDSPLPCREDVSPKCSFPYSTSETTPSPMICFSKCNNIYISRGEISIFSQKYSILITCLVLKNINLKDQSIPYFMKFQFSKSR